MDNNKKKVPLRMCVACRNMKPKAELFKSVLSPEGTIVIDRTGKKPGRGAYICKDESCILKAKKSRAVERALKVPAPPEFYEFFLSEISCKDGT